MLSQSLLIVAVAIPAIYVSGAVVVRFSPPRKRQRGAALAISAAAAAFVFALALAAMAAVTGATSLRFVVFGGATPSFRLDAISLSILVLVTFIGLVTVRFSRNYLDGDPRQHIFFARLLTTLAATTVLALAGDLLVFAFGWIALSLALHGLLIFYGERPLALLAARKKFIVARLGDISLVIAFFLLWKAAGTTDIAAIGAAAVAGNLSGFDMPAAVLIVLAALMKSAQWPFHGWITEVMETPTPVSALLHAGIVNAGGLVVLRFSNLIAESAPALWLLAAVGGVTALFASVVMLTQSRIKTQLAWSTVAQMGFMLLQCGLGAFSSALLHILAHSLYKAHAFLWSGSAAERAPAATSLTGGLRPTIVLASFGLAAVIFMTVAAIFTAVSWEKPAMAVLGTVLVLGMGQALATGLAAGGGVQLLTRLVATMVAISVVYVALQTAMAWFLQGTVHAAPSPSPVITAIAILTLTSFAGLSLIQAMGLHARPPSWLRALHVHAGNGFYANALFNRMAGALHIRNTNSEGSRS